jgi:hypothetical protein
MFYVIVFALCYNNFCYLVTQQKLFYPKPPPGVSNKLDMETTVVTAAPHASQVLEPRR